MAKQLAMFPISTAQDELCNWELVNQSDCSDDSDVDFMFEVKSFDLDDSLHSYSSSSQSELDVDDEEQLDHDDSLHSSSSSEVEDVDDKLDHDDSVHSSSSEVDDVDDEQLDHDDQQQDDDVDDDDGDDGEEEEKVVPIKEDVKRVDLVDVGPRSIDTIILDRRLFFDPSSRFSGCNHSVATVPVDVHDDEDEQEEDDDDGYGMDDELVPWEVKDVYERQRIRKSGKKSLTRLINSKRPAVVFNRAGCVRGKYALGLKGR